MVRVLRVNKLLVYLNSSDEFKVTLKLIKLALFLLLYLHFTACLWYFMIKVSNMETEDFDDDHETYGCSLNFDPDQW